MKQTPRISETEWETTKVAQAEAPCSAGRSIELPTRTNPTGTPRPSRLSRVSGAGQPVLSFLNRLLAGGVRPNAQCQNAQLTPSTIRGTIAPRSIMGL